MDLSRAEKRVTANVLRGATQTKWNYYYSRIRIPANTVSTTTGVINYASGTISKAFSYGRGNDMAPAINGVTGTTATLADTNLQTGNTTISGESLLIKGIGLILQPTSDFFSAKYLSQTLSVQLVLNGNMFYPLGIPDMVPGPGGLMGMAESASVIAPLQDAYGFIGTLTNGVPAASSYLPLPEPIVWLASGQGNDTNLNVTFTVEKSVSTSGFFSQGGNRAAVSSTTATPLAVAAYTAPTTGQIFVDYMTVLIARTFNPLSNN